MNYTADMVAYLLNRTIPRVYAYIAAGMFPNAWRDMDYRRRWMIPQCDVDNFWQAWRDYHNREPPRRVTTGPLCPRCGIVLDNGADLCPDCQQEAAGLGCRWYERSVIRSNWGEGRIL